jgi:rod shape determining protein RodA
MPRTKVAKNRAGFDWIIFILYLSLVGIGLMMIYSTTYHDHGEQSPFALSTVFGKQIIWTVLSIAVLFAVYFIEWNLWNSLSLPLYIIGIISLLALFVFGVEIKGARSWFNLGGFTIQPAEFVKFSTALLIASLLSSIRINLKDFRSQVMIFALIGIPAVLIILQPDPGSAITFLSLFILLYRRGLPNIYYITAISFFITLVLSLVFQYINVISVIFLTVIILFVNYGKSRANWLLFIAACILSNVLLYRYGLIAYALIANAVIAVGLIFWSDRDRTLSTKWAIMGYLGVLCLLSFSSSYAFNNILKPHQQDRINVWLQPQKCDPRGSLYNLLQSKLAIGSGGATGKGYMNGTLTKLNYVPEQTTDFIFSSIGEEQGFIGSASIIVLFLFLILRIIYVGEKSNFLFIACFCYAVAGFLFLHFFINIGMTMGLTPIIGIPLPFVSKGGSSLIAFSIMVGVVLKMNEAR